MPRRCFATSSGRKNGWRELAAALAARGLAVIATGGPAEAERQYLDDVWSGTPVTRLDGQLDLAAARGIAVERARLYRPGYLGDASCGRVRLPDRRALRADRSATLGSVAGGRS